LIVAADEVSVEGALVVDGVGTLLLGNYYDCSPRGSNVVLKDSSGSLMWEAPEVQVLDKWVR
jgi:hypothetical protein